jgi:alkylation response protein AidB-like acyl-CoA dehydrogenase
MTEQQCELVGMIRDFMNKEVKPHIREFEEQGYYPDRLVQMGKEMGLTVMQVPEAYGGLGLDTTTTAMMLEEGAKVESTYMGMFNITNMGAKIVMKVGTEAQKRYYAPPARGRRHGLLLPDRTGHRLGRRVGAHHRH